MTCGCHLDPCDADDPDCDLHLEEPDNDGDQFWKIVYCKEHAAVRVLSDALYAARTIVVEGHDDDRSYQADVLRMVDAAIEKAGLKAAIEC